MMVCSQHTRSYMDAPEPDPKSSAFFFFDILSNELDNASLVRAKENLFHCLVDMLLEYK